MMIIATIRRELLWLLAGLALGLALPVLIFVVGRRVFGPYAGGEAGDLLDNFFQGLGQGVPACWLVALGPWLCLLLLRALVQAIRG